MRNLTARQTLRVTRTLAARHPRETTIKWTRAEFNAQLAMIADELFPRPADALADAIMSAAAEMSVPLADGTRVTIDSNGPTFAGYAAEGTIAGTSLRRDGQRTYGVRDRFGTVVAHLATTVHPVA